jgi:PPM family protein phosphatase
LTVKVTFGAATDIGRARERNEDSYLAEEPLFAVADGMGGHRAGDVASALALETLQDIAASGDWDRLVEQVRKANRAVFDRSTGDRELSGMGTTLTAALTQARAVRLVHVGDSRAYLLRDGELRLLTEDHTLVQRMVREGRITAEEAGTHPQRSILTRALGVEEDVPVDEVSVTPRPDDRIVLCTDGLTGMIREASIKEILEGTTDPQEAAEKLVDAANRAGGLDNVTVLVLDFANGEAEPEDEIGAGDAAGAPVTSEPALPAVALEATAHGRWPGVRALLWAGVALGVLGLAYLGARLYVTSQWYVGIEEGNVAIFNGIPAKPWGFVLQELVERTDMPAAEAQQLAQWQELAQGITADGEDEARDIVDQIRQDLEAEPEPSPTPGPTPTASAT